MGGGIGGGQKDLLGKKADMADPNRPDIQAEMEQEMEDQLSGTGTDFEDAEGLALAFETVKKRYANDPQRLAALEKLEAKNPNASPAKGSASNPMTSAIEGIKPVEGGKPAETKGELYNDFTKKLDVYLGKKEEDAPELKSLKEKASQEAVALVDKYTFDNPKDGEDLDYLVSVYLPYISLAYANYKRTDVPLASNKANTLEDFIKTRNASEIGRFVKVSTGIAFQKDDVSYTKRAIETMRNTMKAKKG
jgi:hypothetical protein